MIGSAATVPERGCSRWACGGAAYKKNRLPAPKCRRREAAIFSGHLGGADGDRTRDLVTASHARSQLRHSPFFGSLMLPLRGTSSYFFRLAFFLAAFFFVPFFFAAIVKPSFKRRCCPPRLHHGLGPIPLPA